MRHNREDHAYKMSLNRFADMTFQEFSDKMLMPRQKVPGPVNSEPADAGDFSEVDWKVSGFTPEILNQGYCGSCWAFSAAEAMSAHYAFKTNQSAPTLSPQELVDCVPESYNCFGCEGGWPSRAMEYALDHLHGGLVRYSDYPYTGQDGQCNTTTLNQTVNVNASSVYNITSGSQKELLYILRNNGPVSVCLDVTMNFQFYSHGIFDDTTCGTDHVNHAVLLYGLYYDSSTQKWAYLVRNSWGVDTSGDDSGWGDAGDIYMNAESMDGNICAIASVASTII